MQCALRVADTVDTGSECRQRPDGHAQIGTRVTWVTVTVVMPEKRRQTTTDFAQAIASSAENPGKIAVLGVDISGERT